MGYAWQGRCFASNSDALTAFINDVPKADPVGITTFTATPTVNASGLITWSISHRPLTGTAATTRTGTTQLPTCTPHGLEAWDIQFIVFVAALFFAAVMGFNTGFRP